MGRLRWFFSGLKFGTIGFGGGLAVLALIRREFVERRRLVDDREFLEVAALAQALPGAVSVNAFTILGTRRAGWAAGLLAGWGFVIPSFLLMLALAMTYPAFRHLPLADSALTGMVAGVVALVAGTAVQLGRAGAITRRCEAGIAMAAFALVSLHWLGVLEAVLLAGCAGILCGAPEWGRKLFSVVPPLALKVLVGTASVSTVVALLAVFLRIGAATFGGGFVMIPFIEQEVVLHHGWLNHTEFADAIALGQVTPGPIVISATFIGYRVAGLVGAVLATTAVFLPPGLLAMVAGRALDRFGRNPVVAGFLAGVRPAVVGLLGSATISLGRAGLHDLSEWGIAAAALLILLRWKMHPMVLLVACAALHIVTHEGLRFGLG